MHLTVVHRWCCNVIVGMSSSSNETQWSSESGSSFTEVLVWFYLSLTPHIMFFSCLISDRTFFSKSKWVLCTLTHNSLWWRHTRSMKILQTPSERWRFPLTPPLSVTADWIHSLTAEITDHHMTSSSARPLTNKELFFKPHIQLLGYQ